MRRAKGNLRAEARGNGGDVAKFFSLAEVAGGRRENLRAEARRKKGLTSQNLFSLAAVAEKRRGYLRAEARRHGERGVTSQ